MRIHLDRSVTFSVLCWLFISCGISPANENESDPTLSNLDSINSSVSVTSSDSSLSLPYGAHLPNRQYVPFFSQLPEIFDPNAYLEKWNNLYPEFSFTAPAATGLTGLVSGSSYSDGPIIADDWVADKDQPVLGLRWWGIFDDWTEPNLPPIPPCGFHLAIWSHNESENLPDALLWEVTVTSPAISYSGDLVRTYVVSDGPDRDSYTEGSACFEYAVILSQEDWFVPPADGTYWLSIGAIYANQPDHPWRNLHFHGDDDHLAKRIFDTTSSWPPTLGCQANYQGLDTRGWGNPVDSFPLTYELISSQRIITNGELYDGWLGDFNQDGQADQKDLEDLIKLYIF